MRCALFLIIAIARKNFDVNQVVSLHVQLYQKLNYEKNNITVVGAGYVGFFNGYFTCKRTNNVTFVEKSGSKRADLAAKYPKKNLHIYLQLRLYYFFS